MAKRVVGYTPNIILDDGVSVTLDIGGGELQIISWDAICSSYNGLGDNLQMLVPNIGIDLQLANIDPNTDHAAVTRRYDGKGKEFKVFTGTMSTSVKVGAPTTAPATAPTDLVKGA